MPKESSLQDIENIRHSFAHVLAAAVTAHHPKVQLGIGPVIENGFYYDFGNVELSEKDLGQLEKEMRSIAKQNLDFTKELWPATKAASYFKKADQPYKLELITDLKKETKTVKKQSAISNQQFRVGIVHTGEQFSDLCRGGHVKNTRELPLDAFRLKRVAGAYWRGNEKNPMLTRIYGIAFQTKEELALYEAQMAEAEKRDHKRLGKELGLFVFSELVGPGLPLFTPKGAFILSQIKEYSKKLREEIGYQLVQTPQINKKELFVISGHHEKYQDDMFHVRSNYTKEEYFLKPMNCPQHTQLYSAEPRSYKDLPLRLADFSLLYRDEKPGELSGLTRLRAFSQDDGHCFLREDQIAEEFDRVLNAIEKAMDMYGLTYWVRLSLRDEKNKEKYLGGDITWKKSQRIMKTLLQKRKMKFQAAEDEAAFYGPKMDIMVKDSLAREWQLSTIQLDFNMPERFSLTYAGQNGKKETPVMIHSAIVGSPERFFGMLIEHYGGVFPLWLAPEQVWIVPVSDKFVTYADTVKKQLLLQVPLLRIVLRDENESLGRKIRDGEKMKVPYLIVVGEKEEESMTVSPRKHGKGDLGEMKVSALAGKLQEELISKNI
ncbi:MAG: threonine--tRNA ligase [bacterium]|nr:threonine--tRNA ligase [bacterium]